MWELRVERKDVSFKELPEREFPPYYEVGEKEDWELCLGALILF